MNQTTSNGYMVKRPIEKPIKSIKPGIGSVKPSLMPVRPGIKPIRPNPVQPIKPIPIKPINTGNRLQGVGGKVFDATKPDTMPMPTPVIRKPGKGSKNVGITE